MIDRVVPLGAAVDNIVIFMGFIPLDRSVDIYSVPVIHT
jgi:hypothetical protein